MKAFHRFSALVATLLLTGSLVAEETKSVPLDFTKELVSGSSNDSSLAGNVAATYNNKIGIIINPNVEDRKDAVRPGKQNVNGPIAALFTGKQGAALAQIAADAAKKNPDQVTSIAAAAIRQNIANGGGSEIDMAIVRSIIDALGTQLEPGAAVILIGLGTDRLAGSSPNDGDQGIRATGDRDDGGNALDEGVRDLRSLYLLKFSPDNIPNAALALDSDLVRSGIASAMNLGDELYAALVTDQIPGIDTNPFFDGDQGIGNVGTQGGGGGSGSGGGGGNDSTPDDPVNPNGPAS